MTLDTVRVVVSKELSISRDCCPSQHGYIRSSQTNLGQSELPHTVGSQRSPLGLAPFTSSLSCQHTDTQSLGHLLTSGKQPHLQPISHSFLGTLGISGGAAENLVLRVLSKNGFATGTTVSSVSTKSWLHHCLALRLHQHQ